MNKLLHLPFLFCLLENYAVHSQLQTCTGPILRFPPPSKGACLTSWSGQRGEDMKYPDDFGGILNKVQIYQCPSSDKRVIISNGIPNHGVTLQNPNGPCEVNWAIEVPLNPTVARERTEVPIRGMIAMAMNGVPAYGPQESDYFNAVEGGLGVQGAGFWYGHAGPNSVWHTHNPKMGRELESHETLMGYAMDGFPIYGHLDDDSLLDPCNGMYKDGTYQYHVRTLEQVDDGLEYCNGNSPETNWNYILGCYAGSVDDTQIYDSLTYSLADDCFMETASSTDAGTSSTQVDDNTTATESTNAAEFEPAASSTENDSIEPSKRPNIIIIQPDDMPFYDIWSPPPQNPSNANKEFRVPRYGLPNIESLRQNGVQMMQAYTASAMCGTSRYSTITSRYPSRALSNDDDTIPSWVVIPSTKLKGDDCTENNIANQFRSNGYRTVMIGKWHLSNIDDSTYSYQSAVDTVKQCGFDTVEGFYLENMAGDSTFSDGSFSHNMEWLSHEAIKVIEEDSEEPFFMYFNPTILHQARSISNALNEFSCRDTAAGVLDEEPTIPGMTDDRSCASYRQTIFERADDEEDLGPIWIDDSVGAIMTALESTGKFEDTIILFQADHGINPKGALYEGGLRIPQFVHYPAVISAGAQVDLPVSVIDIGPTMLEFAGITPSYHMDGQSWKDVVSNDNTPTTLEDRCLYFELQRDRAVRCGCFKYLAIHDHNQGSSTTEVRGRRMGLSTDEHNLFDLCGQPNQDFSLEVTNLMNSEPGRASDFEELLECHLKRIEDVNFSQCQPSTPTTINIAIDGPDITNNSDVTLSTLAPPKSSPFPSSSSSSPSKNPLPSHLPSLLTASNTSPNIEIPSSTTATKMAYTSTAATDYSNQANSVSSSTSATATYSDIFNQDTISTKAASNTGYSIVSTTSTSSASFDGGDQDSSSTEASFKPEYPNVSTVDSPTETETNTIEIILDSNNEPGISSNDSASPMIGIFFVFMVTVTSAVLT